MGRRVLIIKTETTKNDPLVKRLIGTIWPSFKLKGADVVIPTCGGIVIKDGEYEFVK
ncbi:response regulator [Exiguobacterium sp. SH5S4]|uniref:response regulator n=1 Tax=Exiguobacterium sp. SH5S4 TaxID=2510961 RepID=UPI0010408C63|nr:response regulator [Exiguobacterium sp. SH5S4]TCI26715.1 response regulator [Exiguobacterium sp. SH5S4]